MDYDYPVRRRRNRRLDAKTCTVVMIVLLAALIGYAYGAGRLI